MQLPRFTQVDFAEEELLFGHYNYRENLIVVKKILCIQIGI